jgi:hypothetical protein
MKEIVFWIILLVAVGVFFFLRYGRHEGLRLMLLSVAAGIILLIVEYFIKKWKWSEKVFLQVQQIKPLQRGNKVCRCS